MHTQSVRETLWHVLRHHLHLYRLEILMCLLSCLHQFSGIMIVTWGQHYNTKCSCCPMYLESCIWICSRQSLLQQYSHQKLCGKSVQYSKYKCSIKSLISPPLYVCVYKYAHVPRPRASNKTLASNKTSGNEAKVSMHGSSNVVTHCTALLHLLCGCTCMWGCGP